MPQVRGSNPDPEPANFTETVGSSDRASVSVNIATTFTTLQRVQIKKDFPCQLEKVTADHLPHCRVVMGFELFANSNNVKALLMSQPELALKVIADMGTSPATFRRAIYDVKDQWRSWGIDKRLTNLSSNTQHLSQEKVATLLTKIKSP